ncbi:MAG: hypothetical protein L7S71_04095 [Pseudomonadales bacterium]|jgi:hypothetical protein|nr:hypothetical protein [Gammaproteobacteria bacterium]MCH1597398.1 hypothetical protein [Pseudomonadales bacterium]RPG31875.1 MAG: hypothetical protein CBE03_006020 [Gammaproteobacteria bacterium TMED243]|tara:strand:- start:2833 stop:3120 length:288 start_codon:yes stop_codon:yes gene_type:complete
MIEFHNPQGERAVPADPYTLGIDLAANPPSVVGLLANGFPDSENFLRHVGTELERLIDGIEVRVWNKGNASIAAPDSMLDEIQAQCDAVIAAYGH